MPDLVLPDGTKAEAKKTEESQEPDWTETPFPIELFDNNIVIRRDDVEEMTEGGIILPETARKGQFRTMVGTVIAIGPGTMKGDGSCIPMRVAAGERVVFRKFQAMTELTINGFSYHLLDENGLLGKMAEGGSSKIS